MKKLALALALSALMACGGDTLTEQSAKRLIEERSSVVYGVEIPKLMADVGDSHRSAVNRLRKQGLLVYDYPDGGEAGIVLSQDGLVHLHEEQVETFVMTGWSEKVVEISGFRLQEDGSGVAEVVVECENLTPFAAAFSQAEFETRYTAQIRISRKKSGEGWRLSQPKNPYVRRLANKGVENLPTWRASAG